MDEKKKYKETIEFNSAVERNKLSVVKSNKLIEARYKLTLNEQRLILLMVSMIKPEDEDFKNIRIRIQDLKEFLDLQRKDLYEEIPEITRKLISRVVEIRDLKEKRLLQISWLSSAEYNFGEGVIELSFDPKLKPYLLKLKEAFTIYNLQSVLKLRSSYSIRFYELLKQYEKIGNRKFKLEDLRNVLGIGKNEYKLYGDFKRRVILPAQKELKEKTDIYFEFEEIKNKRKVVELVFHIYKNPDFSEVKGEKKELVALKNINQELLDEIKRYTSLSEKKLMEIFRNYDEEFIRKTFDYAIKKYREKKVKNLTAFFLSGLKENFFKLSPFEEEKVKKKKEAEEQKRLALELEEELAELNKKYRLIIRDNVMSYYEALPNNLREELKDEFINSIVKENAFLEKDYSMRGFDSEVIQSKFTGFLISKLMDEIDFEYENIIDFLRQSNFDFSKLEKVKHKFKGELAVNLSYLLYWIDKIKSLNIPIKFLVSYHLEKFNLNDSIEKKVINYIFENLPKEEKEALLEEAKKYVDKNIVGKYKMEALKLSLKKLIKEKFNL